MKIIDVKCKNCGAVLKTDGRVKNVKCEFCGSNFILDDEVQTVKHVMAGQISEEQEFINAETNLNKLKDYYASYNGYLSLSQRYVDNKEVWLGLLRSYTEDFTCSNIDSSFIPTCERYYNNYKALATKKEVDEITPKYNGYMQEVEQISKDNFMSDYHYTQPEAEADTFKTPEVMLFITIFLGSLGVHKFMEGKTVMGVIYLLTFGLFGIGWLIDVIIAIKNCLIKK